MKQKMNIKWCGMCALPLPTIMYICMLFNNLQKKIWRKYWIFCRQRKFRSLNENHFECWWWWRNAFLSCRFHTQAIIINKVSLWSMYTICASIMSKNSSVTMLSTWPTSNNEKKGWNHSSDFLSIITWIHF